MFISIITVVFNGEKTIERTIKSVLNQKFTDYEYIIQDGGSKDNTLQIAKSYEDKFAGCLRIYTEQDKGIYDAMNKGICKAKGDYIWMVNADDYLCEDALMKIYDYCKSINFKPCLLSARMNIVDATTGDLKAISKSDSVDSYQNNCKRLKMGICHPATIVHKEIYNQVGLYDDRYYISADIDFCIRTYKSKISVEFPSIVITNMTDGGISNQFSIKKNMHDCNLRASKFCTSTLNRIKFTTWYFFRLLVLKCIGYRS